MAYKTIKNCPHCGKPIDLKLETKKFRYMLGETEIYRCSHCGKLITNGLKEWPEMSKVEKAFERFYIFAKAICLISVLFLAVWMPIILLSTHDKETRYWLWIIISFGGVFSGVYAGVKMCKDAITESIVRYTGNQQQNRPLKAIKVVGSASLDISAHIKTIKDKLDTLSNKIKILRKNMTLLAPDEKTDDCIDAMIMYLTSVKKKFDDYYDKYGSIFLQLNFEKMALDINARNIETIDIPSVLKTIDENMAQILKHVYSGIEDDSFRFRETNNFLIKYKDRMIDLKTHLIAAQTKLTISNTSPIDEDEILKLFKFEKNQLLGKKDIDDLNDEYDKFMAEIEASNL
jgi:predicted RNA-binding Zn-ribbon protein involved in translation (DUF1610 family)